MSQNQTQFPLKFFIQFSLVFFILGRSFRNVLKNPLWRDMILIFSLPLFYTSSNTTYSDFPLNLFIRQPKRLWRRWLVSDLIWKKRSTQPLFLTPKQHLPPLTIVPSAMSPQSRTRSESILKHTGLCGLDNFFGTVANITNILIIQSYLS